MNSESSDCGSKLKSAIDPSAAGRAPPEIRLDRDVGILVLDVHRQLELLRDVVRIQLERAFGLAQRALEVAEIREREAHVVVRFGEVGPRLNRARERVARVLEFPQLGEHEADAVPRDRMSRASVRST